MGKKANNAVGVLAVIGVVGYIGYSNFWPESFDPVPPNWEEISAWPPVEAEIVDAQPDPNRTYTAIVLDDSGSMSSNMEAARQAVIEAVGFMADDDWVSVIALNRGEVLPFMSASDARQRLLEPLSQVQATGSTPLTRAIATARSALAVEAAEVGGFGTFRVLVTTDGAADDGDALLAEIEDLARSTPIQLATIGVGIGNRHVLNRADLGTFVAIDDVSGLTAALQSAVAEQTSFAAITDFGG